MIVPILFGTFNAISKMAYPNLSHSKPLKIYFSKSDSEFQKEVFILGVRSVHFRWVAYKYLYINTYLDFSNRDRLVYSQNLIFNCL